MSNDLIERFLRNNLDDDDYKEYSAALDELCTPKRPWVGLTQKERDDVWYSVRFTDPDELAKAIEAKLKEKNT